MLEERLNAKCKDKSLKEKLPIYAESRYATTRALLNAMRMVVLTLRSALILSRKICLKWSSTSLHRAAAALELVKKCIDPAIRRQARRVRMGSESAGVGSRRP